MWHGRLSRVQLDNRDALEVIRYWDSPETFFYIDPPYVADTRKSKKIYNHETTDDHHQKLVSLLLKIRGGVVVSGYKHEIYAPLDEAGWKRYEFEAHCHIPQTRIAAISDKNKRRKQTRRTEVLWVKPFPANKMLF